MIWVSHEAKINFAYKYPFTKEAKEIVEGMNDVSDRKYLAMAKARVEEALETGSISYRKIGMESEMIASIISYGYARLLISAKQNLFAISKYAEAEANRSAFALYGESNENVIALASELGLPLERSEENFIMPMEVFLNKISSKSYLLANQVMDKGKILIESGKIADMLKSAIAAKVREGLPIQKKNIPDFIMEASRSIQLHESINAPKEGEKAWIEKILLHPIPDGRHRVVNLILAPYLVNVRKMDEEEAARIIIDYINKCKAIDPTTKLTDEQILYQCKYSKSKGMRPLSLQKAKDLLAGITDISFLE
ncbi:MAG: DNA primase noncatalytic subunit PriX [Candidatus Micrarchaeaceae archaeon]